MSKISDFKFKKLLIINIKKKNEPAINGFEYTFDDLVSFRGGYKSLFLQDSEEGFTLGFGLKQLFFGNVAVMVDYAYQNFGRLSDIQKFSLSINF